MKIQELMVTDVVTAHSDESLNVAARKMKESRIKHLPVLDRNDHVVGIITDRDIKRASASDATLLEVHELLYLLDQIKLEDVMTKRPISATPEMSVSDAASLLVKHHIGCLPVVTGNKMAGLVTTTDFLRYVAEHTS